jgi:hypothetical protein
LTYTELYRAGRPVGPAAVTSGPAIGRLGRPLLRRWSLATAERPDSQGRPALLARAKALPLLENVTFSHVQLWGEAAMPGVGAPPPVARADIANRYHWIAILRAGRHGLLLQRPIQPRHREKGKADGHGHDFE